MHSGMRGWGPRRPLCCGGRGVRWPHSRKPGESVMLSNRLQICHSGAPRQRLSSEHARRPERALPLLARRGRT
ncbi:hypothetical protein RR42_s2247 [Cupriavidus basilensis]|uniref:Uncharacterized protein n=1 Tax=Cupriavidus basilensis TaxID=68895 RepID=A0A0C4YP28_9BURK|nr:hypothetical protein RR42_s2247 [Cupriavidus basilensis]